MYWAAVTRVPRIANAMSRDRYVKIRNNLKVFDDDTETYIHDMEDDYYSWIKS